jgi:hypothetical protein
MNSTICDGIQSHRVLQFSYDGGMRRVEPHCHGRSKEGHDLLRAYQLSGVSQSREATGWKLFPVDQINSMSVTSDIFSGPRQGYDKRDDAMAYIYCCI